MNFIYRSTHMRWSIPQDPTERLRELCATLNDIPIQHTKTKNRKRKTKTKTRNTILCSILCSFLHLHRWKMKGNNQFNHRERNYRDDDRYSDRWNYDNRGSPQKKAAATPPKSAKVLAMTHSANKTAMAMKDDKCMRLAENILTSGYGLGSLQTPVTIFQALGELLETDIDVNLIMVSQAARLKAFDRLATAIAARLDNDIALPIYDAVRLKAASMVTPPPTTPTATQSQPQQSTTMVEILESSETTTSQMEEPAKRKRTTSKRKNQDEREETQPNERTKRVKTRNV